MIVREGLFFDGENTRWTSPKEEGKGLRCVLAHTVRRQADHPRAATRVVAIVRLLDEDGHAVQQLEVPYHRFLERVEWTGRELRSTGPRGARYVEVAPGTPSARTVGAP